MQSWLGLSSRCAAWLCIRARLGFLMGGSVSRIRKAIDDFSGPHKIELFARELLEIGIVIANTVNALAQSFVFFLQTKILLIQAIFFATQSPEVQNAALTDDTDRCEQNDQRTKEIDQPVLRYGKAKRHRQIT